MTQDRFQSFTAEETTSVCKYEPQCEPQESPLTPRKWVQGKRKPSKESRLQMYDAYGKKFLDDVLSDPATWPKIATIRPGRIPNKNPYQLWTSDQLVERLNESIPVPHHSSHLDMQLKGRQRDRLKAVIRIYHHYIHHHWATVDAVAEEKNALPFTVCFLQSAGKRALLNRQSSFQNSRAGSQNKASPSSMGTRKDKGQNPRQNPPESERHCGAYTSNRDASPSSDGVFNQGLTLNQSTGTGYKAKNSGSSSPNPPWRESRCQTYVGQHVKARPVERDSPKTRRSQTFGVRTLHKDVKRGDPSSDGVFNHGLTLNQSDAAAYKNKDSGSRSHNANWRERRFQPYIGKPLKTKPVEEDPTITRRSQTFEVRSSRRHVNRRDPSSECL